MLAIVRLIFLPDATGRFVNPALILGDFAYPWELANPYAAELMLHAFNSSSF